MSTWRIVMVQETGERVAYGDRSFQSADAACAYIDRVGLDSLHPECRFYVETDILDARALHLDMCASQDDTMSKHPACDCGAATWTQS